MSKKHNQKLITPEILRQAVIGSFTKLNPRYMMKNPVMFVVEVGFVITLILSFVPDLFGGASVAEGTNLRAYNIIVCVILLITVLFANFAESVAEGRGKAQAASLKKTQKDTEAHLLKEDGTQETVLSNQLKKGDVVLVSAGEIIPGDGEVIEGIASVDESAITGESAPVVRESGGDFCSVTGGYWAIGGYVPQYEGVGKSMGEYAYRFLDQKETGISSINILPNRYKFDAKKLKEWGLSLIHI